MYYQIKKKVKWIYRICSLWSIHFCPFNLHFCLKNWNNSRSLIIAPYLKSLIFTDIIPSQSPRETKPLMWAMTLYIGSNHVGLAFLVLEKCFIIVFLPLFLSISLSFSLHCQCWKYFSYTILRLMVCYVVLFTALLVCSSTIISLVWGLSLKKIFSKTLFGWLMRLIVL